MNRGAWPVTRGPCDVFSGKRKAHNAGSGYMSEESLASSVPSSASTAALHAELKAMKARLDGFEAAGPQPVFSPQSSGNSMKSDDKLVAELKQVRDEPEQERTRRRRAESTVGLLGLQLMVVGLVGDVKKDACVLPRAQVQEQWRISFGSEMSAEDWTSWERLLPQCLRSKENDVSP